MFSHTEEVVNLDIFENALNLLEKMTLKGQLGLSPY